MRERHAPKPSAGATNERNVSHAQAYLNVPQVIGVKLVLHRSLTAGAESRPSSKVLEDGNTEPIAQDNVGDYITPVPYQQHQRDRRPARARLPLLLPSRVSNPKDKRVIAARPLLFVIQLQRLPQPE